MQNVNNFYWKVLRTIKKKIKKIFGGMNNLI